jgi:recombination protein RecT
MSNAVAINGERLGTALAKFESQLAERAQQFKVSLPSHITPEKFQRTVLTAAQANPDILTADRGSLVTACMKAAQDGLLPDGREAALVIFSVNKKTEQGWEKHKLITFMPMVFGLRKKILQSGEIRDIQTSVVYRQEIEAGLFVYEEGTERMLRHKPLLDPEFNPTDDDIAAAYSVATFKDGSFSFEVMRRSEINKIREASQTGATRDKKGQPRTSSGPWVDWFSEMARKSVMRRHSKTLPMSGDIIDDESYGDVTAAYSAQHVLSQAEPDAPTFSSTPPSRTQTIDHVAEESFDPSTGEILSEEDSARLLDAQTFAGDGSNAYAEGPAVEQRGEVHNDADDEEAASDLRAELAGKIIARINGRNSDFAINNILKECKADIDAMPEELSGAIYAAKRDRLAELEKAEAA